MLNSERVKVYAAQRGITRGPLLENIGVYAEVSYWNVARKLTPRQHRRWLHKRNRPTNPPF